MHNKAYTEKKPFQIKKFKKMYRSNNKPGILTKIKNIFKWIAKTTYWILMASMIGFSNAYLNEEKMIQDIRRKAEQEQIINDEDKNRPDSKTYQFKKFIQQMRHRADHELPEAIDGWGWKYHHTGMPTTEKKPGERYLPHLKFYVSGFDTSPFGIEWMRFDKDCPIDPLIQTVPHLAFVVPDLDYELANRGLNIITPPNYPSGGLRVAMVEHNGAPIELMEFENK